MGMAKSNLPHYYEYQTPFHAIENIRTQAWRVSSKKAFMDFF
jgi:hypothetical protein